MPKPLHEREPLDHNGECVYCDEPALTVADHASDCPWRLAVEAALPLPAGHPDAGRDCPHCGRRMSEREAREQGACNHCTGGR